MPNIKSAKKRVKVNQAKTIQNKARSSALKTYIKKAALSIEENSSEKEEAVRIAVKKIDQAAAHGLIHKNCAARKKSALACKLSKA